MRNALWKCAAPLLLVAAIAPAQPVIIDTDAGTDDLMAIAFLLGRPGVKIEAVTVANGLAHVPAGARNVLRLLALGGRPEIPVFEGRRTSLEGQAAFPAEWRNTADHLPGVRLPAAGRAAERRSAAEFLVERLRHTDRPVRILALGPLTNLGEALRRAPESVGTIAELVIMGGAIRVPGNLGDGGYFKTNNRAAEWNLYVDPLAASIVFGSGFRIRLIPLDATNKVPISLNFLAEFERDTRGSLANFVSQVLEAQRPQIREGIFCAWDPLAAAALVEPAVVTVHPLRIAISHRPPELGRTIETPGRPPNAYVALDADAAAFRAVFLKAFQAAAGAAGSFAARGL